MGHVHEGPTVQAYILRGLQLIIQGEESSEVVIVLRAFLDFVRVLELDEQPLNLCDLALAVIKLCLLVDI